MKYILFSIFILILSVGNVMATEEIAYKVLKESGDIEIREYEEAVAAEVNVEATRRDATGKAFRTLFNYIDGENRAEQNIAMTTPVSQVSSQKIPMTAPVSQKENDDGQWTIAFYMPNDMTYENAPAPKNEAINIRKVPAQKMAAITFSGRATDNNIYEHEKELRKFLETNNISFIDRPMYAFYNSPMMPWFLRRNEVLFTLND